MKYDRYGWKLPDEHVAEDKKLVAKESRKETEREVKWSEMLAHWDDHCKHDNDKIESRVMKGIPKSIRPRAWRLLMDPTRVDVQWGETSEKDKQIVVTGSPEQSKTIGIYHYVGVGYPPPEPDRIWVRNPSFADSGWRSFKDMAGVFSLLCFLVLDCDRATILREFLMVLYDKHMNSMYQLRSFFALFACAQNKVLRLPSHLPQNFLSRAGFLRSGVLQQ